MPITKLKIVTAVLLAVSVLGVGAGLLARRALADKPAGAGSAPPPAAKDKLDPKAPPGPAGAKREVTGRVLDANGKPVAAAEVVIVAWPMRLVAGHADNLADRPDILGRGQADRKGRFRLKLPFAAQRGHAYFAASKSTKFAPALHQSGSTGALSSLLSTSAYARDSRSWVPLRSTR